jgi:class 3 adenylate cyclase
MQAGKGEKQRLAIRAVITVGDILHHEKETIGMTMSLTARIANITPPDEIYLSHAAWLMLNKAEVQTAFASEFNFKGFNEPEKIYRVVQKHKTRVLTNQYIVFTDVRSWMWYTGSKGIEDVENFLLEYDDLMNEICDRYGGIIRNTSGDEYFLTFSETNAFFPAMEKLCSAWRNMLDRFKLGISVAAHKGDLNVLRSYLYGSNIHTTFYLEELTRLFYPARESISVAISGKVKESAQGTIWEPGIRDMDKSKIISERLQAWIEEHGAYWFIAEGATKVTAL